MERVISVLLTCVLLAQSLPLSARAGDTPLAVLEQAARSGSWVEVAYVWKSRRRERGGFVVRIREDYVAISRSKRGRGRRIPIEDFLSVHIGYSKVVAGSLVRVKALSVSQRRLEGVVTAITSDSLTIQSDRNLQLNAIREPGKLPVFLSIPALQPFPIALEAIQKLDVLIGEDDWDRVPMEHVRLPDGVILRDVAAFAKPEPAGDRDSDQKYGAVIRLRTPDGPHPYVIGNLISVGADSIVVLDASTSGRRVAVPLGSVYEIQVRRWKRNVGGGATKGFLVGIAAGGLLGAAASRGSEYSGARGPIAGVAALFMGGLGALFGAATGAKTSPSWEATTVEELRLEVKR